jgi:hypothetical protein
MFKLMKSPISVWWEITIRIPAEDGMIGQEHTIELQYRVPTDLREGGALSAAPLAELITGWRGVADEDGAELPFSPETKAALLANPFVLRAADAGLRQIYAGDFQRKN